MKDKAAEKRKRVVPTKRFWANTVSKPSEAATCPPTTIPKAPTKIKPKVQEGTPDNRPPPLEDARVCESTPWPDTGKISGIFFEERKDWLLPLNYLNNDNKDTTGISSPKPPIKEEPKIEEQSFTSTENRQVWMGTKLPLLQKSRKGRRLGWQLPKTTATENTSPTRGSDAQNKVPPDSKLPETPELTEAQSKDIK